MYKLLINSVNNYELYIKIINSNNNFIINGLNQFLLWLPVEYLLFNVLNNNNNINLNALINI